MYSKCLLVPCVVCSGISVCWAGGIERKNQSLSSLNEAGNFIYLSYSSFLPAISGTDVSGQPTGNVSENFNLLGFGAKWELNDKAAVAVLFDQPYGVSTTYAGGSPVLGGTSTLASVDSFTSVLQYRFDNQFSWIGGLDVSAFDGRAALIGAAYGELSGYSAVMDRSVEVGYLVGASYEIPAIKFNAALTYRSEIEHNSGLQESISQNTSDLSVTLPRSLSIDVSTGVSKDALMFASLNWKEWSDFKIQPPLLTAVSGQNLVSFREDTVSYSLGVAKQLTAEWVAGVRLGYEAAVSGEPSPLGPVNGYNEFGLFASYRYKNSRYTFGYSNISFGDAEPAIRGVQTSQFSDNSGAGLSFTYSYWL